MPEASEAATERAESPPRRHLTLLFTDLSQSTRLSGQLEAEVTAELLDDVRAVFERTVASYGGTVNQLQGDGFQAVFGHPVGTEEDGQHATEAALDIHEQVRTLQAKYAWTGISQLSVHSGVHAGFVLMRPGDEIAGRYRLYGQVPGTAKHLSDMAGADEILVSDETLGPMRHFFRTETKRLDAKHEHGRDLPVCHRVLARSGIRTRFEAHTRRGLMPFVGRHDELVALGNAVTQAASGTPRFVAISAAPGVGKTRLAEEFLRRATATGCQVLRGYCERELSAEPLQPFLQMLRPLLGVAAGLSPTEAVNAVEQRLSAIDPSLPACRDDLLSVFSLPTASNGQPFGSITALRRLFTGLARHGPLIVFIDDWQWADAATRQVLHALRNLPLMLLVATRPFQLGDAELTAADVIELATFTEEETASTIRLLHPTADPFVARDIQRYSGGNPLYIEELCHSASSPSGALFSPQRGSSWLESLISSRVARLPADQARLLRTAAVVGNVVPLQLLDRLTGCGREHPSLAALAAQDFVFPGDRSGTLRFKHGITRDVVYAGIGLDARQTMHREIAALVAQGIEPGREAETWEALAYHHAGAGDHEAAARHAKLAGDKAVATSSLDRAKVQYQAALDMLDRLPSTPERYDEWRSIMRLLGRVSVFDPSRRDLTVFHRAITLAQQHHDAPGLAFAQYWLAYIHYALGELRSAVTLCETALAQATALGLHDLAGQARAILGQALAAAADYPRALDLLNVASPAPRRADARPAPGVAFSLACKASVLGDMGQFDAAYACFDEALRSLPRSGHEVEGSVLCWRSGVELWQGRWGEALATARAAQQIGERVKSLYLFAMSRGLGAFAEWQQTQQAEPLARLREAVAWLEAHNKGLFLSLAYGWLAEASASEMRADDTRSATVKALRRARKRDWFGSAMALRAAASMAARQGDWHRAMRHIAAADAVAAVRASPHERASNTLCRARLALARNDLSLAHSLAARAIDSFLGLQMAWHADSAAQFQRSLHRGHHSPDLSTAG